MTEVWIVAHATVMSLVSDKPVDPNIGLAHNNGLDNNIEAKDT